MNYTKPNLTYLCILAFIIGVGAFDSFTSMETKESQKIEILIQEKTPEQLELPDNDLKTDNP